MQSTHLQYQQIKLEWFSNILYDYCSILKFIMILGYIMLSDWLKFSFSSQKPHKWWKHCIIVGMFLTWPYRKIVSYLSTENQRWPPPQDKVLTQDSIRKWIINYFYVQLESRLRPIWLKPQLSLAPLYRNVMAQEILRNHIAGHMSWYIWVMTFLD